METKAEIIGKIIDHLVDALGGEPGTPLRRALLLADIQAHPDTALTEIITRLGIDKSTANRDIEWLYDYGCIVRRACPRDARIMRLQIIGYARTHIENALKYFENNSENLKLFLNQYMNIFKDLKNPTLRDAKILAVLGSHDAAERQKVFEKLYGSPSTTEHRALNNLVKLGLIEKQED